MEEDGARRGAPAHLLAPGDDLQNHNILGKRDKVEMKAIESLPYDEDGNLATEQGPHCDDEYTHDIYRNHYNTDTLLLSGGPGHHARH